MNKETFKADLIQLINAATEAQEIKDNIIKSMRITKGLMKGEFTAWMLTENSGRVPVKSSDLYDDYIKNYPRLARKGITANVSTLEMLDLHLPEINPDLVRQYLHEQGITVCIAPELLTASMIDHYIAFREQFQSWKRSKNIA